MVLLHIEFNAEEWLVSRQRGHGATEHVQLTALHIQMHEPKALAGPPLREQVVNTTHSDGPAPLLITVVYG